MTRVAVLDDYQGRAHELADWKSLGDEVEVVFFHDPIPSSELAARLGEFEVIVAMRERTRFPVEVLARLPDLALMVTTGMGNAAIDLTHLRDRGIPLCGTGMSGGADRPGVPSTVEVAWALILAVAKRVALEDAALRAGRWQIGIPFTLAGATLGLAGLGNLGTAMVGPARAFGMQVIAWSEHLSAERAAEVGVARVSKRDLLAASDVLSIHLVLSDRTRGLFGADDLSQMKETAVLINTSRGPIVDERALVSALRDGTIAGAGLDVYDTEPLPAEHPLTKLGNVVLLPHLGYVSEPGLRHMYEQVVQDIAAWRDGDPIRLIA
jgi:phosphoglycerate dehydrogenase-like enzyme